MVRILLFSYFFLVGMDRFLGIDLRGVSIQQKMARKCCDSHPFCSHVFVGYRAERSREAPLAPLFVWSGHVFFASSLCSLLRPLIGIRNNVR